MKKVIILSLIAFIIAGCGSNGNKSSLTDLKKLSLKQVAIFLDSDEWMLSAVNQLAIDSDNNIIFIDRGAPHVYVLNSNGKLIQTIGNQGDGPGEFQMVGNLELINDNRFFVVDFIQRRISEFIRQDGKWVYKDVFNFGNSPALSIAQFYLLHNGNFLVNNAISITGNQIPEMDKISYRKINFLITDSDGEILIESLLELMGFPLFLSQADGSFKAAVIPFMEQEVYTVSPSGYLYLANNLESIIIKHNASLEQIQMFEFEAQRFPVTSDDREEFLENHEGGFKNTLRGLLPDVKPVISSMIVSDEDQLWVNIFGKEHNRSWIIFNSDSSIKGKIELPERTELKKIRGNLIYTVQLDEDDVPTIVVYELSY